MYTVRSTDNGKSFGSATKLGKGTWPLKSCPMDGGAIAQTNEGENASVWRREKSIYLTVSPANTEIELGKGEQPWLSTTSAGVAAVWLTKRGGTLLYRKANEKASIELAKSASDPTIASDSVGGPVAIAWESTAGSKTRILCHVEAVK